MSFRSLLISCGAVIALTSACSNNPAAPSNVISTGALPSVSATQPGVSTVARFGDRTPGVVYVTSQGLYYDTFARRDPLPMEGPFQLLADGTTEFGPGDPGYLGGRWWEDVNGDGTQDAGDHYFLCPLLPPGRTTP
jgi:hypothetical protein